MEIRDLIRGNLFGMPTSGRDDWKLNKLTLGFQWKYQAL